MDPKVQTYINILTIAAGLGSELVALIKNHAQGDLSAADYQALEANWNSDVIRSAVDAGITPQADNPIS